MSEPDKPKRPWFRFHLLTALVMMFTAGATIGLKILGPILSLKAEWSTLAGSKVAGH